MPAYLPSLGGGCRGEAAAEGAGGGQGGHDALPGELRESWRLGGGWVATLFLLRCCKRSTRSLTICLANEMGSGSEVITTSLGMLYIMFL